MGKKASATAEPIEETPVENEDGVDLDKLEPLDEIDDDGDQDGQDDQDDEDGQDDQGDQDGQDDQDDEDGQDDQDDQDDQDGDGEQEDQDDKKPEPKDKTLTPPAAGELGEDDSDLDWLDNPDLHDDLGGIDGNKLAAHTQRIANARSLEVSAIIRDVKRSVPEASADYLEALRDQILASPADPKALRAARRGRSVTGQVRLQVDEAISQGKLRRKTEKAPPVPKRTPANNPEEEKPRLTSKEEAEIRAMVRHNPGMDEAALRKSYAAGKKKKK